jgi:hypothetical protein
MNAPAGEVTSGQMHLATGYARDLVDALYSASQQEECGAANLSNISKAKAATARIAELLGCVELAEQIRKAA